jgi:methyltransferase (TIGR00027 family)
MSSPAPVEDVTDTARWVAHYRAVESERPDALFRDPFARRLAGERGSAMAKALPRLFLDWVIPVRTRVYDELIMERIASGKFDTVLNLAAGLDTRPYRLPLPASLRWIEVDLPSLMAMKEDALAGEQAVCGLERLSVDLANDSARKKMFEGLRCRDGSTLVVTEGLLAYLDEPNVAALAADLGSFAGASAWVLEAAAPEVLARARRGWGRTLEQASAAMKFAPASGLDFFRPFGWQAMVTRSLTTEAQRLRREMRFVAITRAVSTLTARGRDRWQKIALYAVMERTASRTGDF